MPQNVSLFPVLGEGVMEFKMNTRGGIRSLCLQPPAFLQRCCILFNRAMSAAIDNFRRK